MNKILIATDGSPAATEAVAFGVELATEHDAEVIVVHVAPGTDAFPSMAFPMIGAVPHTVDAVDRAPLGSAEAYAEEHGIAARTALLVGDTVNEIVAYADSLDVDLIVIGSRGHGAVTAALLGSISRGILAESKRPVLVVRGKAVREPAIA